MVEKKFITKTELRTVLDAALTKQGSLRDNSGRAQRIFERAQNKVETLSKADILVPFSQRELEVLFHVVKDRAGDGFLDTYNFTSEEKAAFGRAANRIADAGCLVGSRYYVGQHYTLVVQKGVRE